MMVDASSFPLQHQESLDYSVINSIQTTTLGSVIIFSLRQIFMYYLILVFLSLKQPISICFLSCRKIKHLQAGKFTHNLFTTTWEPIQFQVSSASSNKLGIRLTEKMAIFFVLSFSLCYLKSEPERQRKPIQRSFHLLYKEIYSRGYVCVEERKKTLVVTTIPCCTL